jgi:hypothetical protein
MKGEDAGARRQKKQSFKERKISIKIMPHKTIILVV